jgi:hypothetical protein
MVVLIVRVAPLLSDRWTAYLIKAVC